MIRIEYFGQATLYLGDCQEIVPNLGTLDSVVTDPPYGMRYQSKQRQHRAIANDNSIDMLTWATRLQVQHSKYVFCRWNNLRDLPLPKSVITWVKNVHTAGDTAHAHARQTELTLFYPGPEHFFPTGRPTDVLAAPKTRNQFHPTEKPLALMQAIVNWTHGRVVDPFMGSGTTGVACISLGRPFVGIELDQMHFDVACWRLEEACRQPPALIPLVRKFFQPSPISEPANDD